MSAAAESGAATRAAPQEITFAADDGCSLAGSLFTPQTKPRASVLVSSAMAVPRTYYASFAKFLASEGFRVLTYDYRGIGGSRPNGKNGSLRGFAANVVDWGERDASAALDRLAQEDPSAPLLLIAHSVGGQIVGLMRGHERLRGAFLVASQSGDWRNWPMPGRLGMILVWYAMIPSITRLFGYAPGRMGLGEDVPKGVALQWAQWGRRKSYLLGGDGAKWRDRYAAVRTPIVAVSIDDDTYAPRPTVEALLSFYPNAPKEHRHIAPRDIGAKKIGHFGFFRSAYKDTLWRQAAEWLGSTAPSR